jgi:hypothetical protein
MVVCNVVGVAHRGVGMSTLLAYVLLAAALVAPFGRRRRDGLERVGAA